VAGQKHVCCVAIVSAPAVTCKRGYSPCMCICVYSGPLHRKAASVQQFLSSSLQLKGAQCLNWLKRVCKGMAAPPPVGRPGRLGAPGTSASDGLAAHRDHMCSP
jgi:hypothetical protein